MPDGPTLEMPGKLVMDAPFVSPESAIANLDQLVATWTCDRTVRVGLEQSIKVLRDLVQADAARQAAEAEAAKTKPAA